MPHLRLLNHSGMAFSTAAHLTVLTVGLGYAGVRPFETLPTEAIAVDIVSPGEVKAIPDLSSIDRAAASSISAAPSPAQQQPAQQATPSAPPATPNNEALQPVVQRPP